MAWGEWKVYDSQPVMTELGSPFPEARFPQMVWKPPRNSLNHLCVRYFKALCHRMGPKLHRTCRAVHNLIAFPAHLQLLSTLHTHSQPLGWWNSIEIISLHSTTLSLLPGVPFPPSWMSSNFTLDRVSNGATMFPFCHVHIPIRAFTILLYLFAYLSSQVDWEIGQKLWWIHLSISESSTQGVFNQCPKKAELGS